MKRNESNKEIKKIKSNRILIPIVLGLGIVGWFVYKDFNKINFNIFEFSWKSLLVFLGAFLMMMCRDLGYVIRIRILSSSELSWIQCIKIVFLWEFGSAITPSAVGGTALATIFLWKEGLNFGKSTSIVLSTSFLDELYFSIMFPIVLLYFGKSTLFQSFSENSIYNNLFGFAISGYSVKLLWTIIVGYSLFINPKFFANIVKVIFKIKFLRKWKKSAEKMAIDFEIANKELKNKNLIFWIKSFLATFLSWSARYCVLNFILVAVVLSTNLGNFPIYTINEHFLIFARQLIMWIIMLVLPSPGGSGFIEAIFKGYMANFIPIAGFSIVVALIWRLLTYYPYLIIGAIITPNWINKKFRKQIKTKKI